MILDLSRLDFFDASKSDSAITCYRHPEPLYIESKGPVINIFNIRNGRIDRSTIPITLPAMTLNKFFKKWPDLKQISIDKGVYYKEPGPCHAVIIETGNNPVSANIGAITCEVETGDYIITRESGLNEICKKADFEKIFVTSMSKLKDPFIEFSITANNDLSIT